MLGYFPFFSIQRQQSTNILKKYFIDENNKIKEMFENIDFDDIDLQVLPAAKIVKIGISLESFLIDHKCMQDPSLIVANYLRQKRIV